MRRLSLFVVAFCALAAPSWAQISLAPDAVAPAMFQAPSATDWQKQYDAAKSRRQGGLQKMLIGVGVAVAGPLVLASTASCDVDSLLRGQDCSSRAGLYLLTAGAGGGVFWWGVYDYLDANGDVQGLEANRPARATASLQLGSQQSVAFSIGSTSRIAYQFRW